MDYVAHEGEGQITVLLTKLEATTENITVPVTLVTFEEFEKLNREFESVNSIVQIPDAAECKLELCYT